MHQSKYFPTQCQIEFMCWTASRSAAMPHRTGPDTLLRSPMSERPKWIAEHPCCRSDDATAWVLVADLFSIYPSYCGRSNRMERGFRFCVLLLTAIIYGHLKNIARCLRCQWNWFADGLRVKRYDKTPVQFYMLVGTHAGHSPPIYVKWVCAVRVFWGRGRDGNASYFLIWIDKEYLNKALWTNINFI